jgi:hypothetical protein
MTAHDSMSILCVIPPLNLFSVIQFLISAQQSDMEKRSWSCRRWLDVKMSAVPTIRHSSQMCHKSMLLHLKTFKITFYLYFVDTFYQYYCHKIVHNEMFENTQWLMNDANIHDNVSFALKGNCIWRLLCRNNYNKVTIQWKFFGYSKWRPLYRLNISNPNNFQVFVDFMLKFYQLTLLTCIKPRVVKNF